MLRGGPAIISLSIRKLQCLKNFCTTRSMKITEKNLNRMSTTSFNIRIQTMNKCLKYDFIEKNKTLFHLFLLFGK